MSRKEFLERLDLLLCDIPEEEREEAVQYYRDYFDDAGSENETKVIEELGSPEKVAAVIRTGMEPLQDEYSEYSETGYSDTRFEDRKVPERRGYMSGTEDEKSDAEKDNQYAYGSGSQKAECSEEKKKPWTSNTLKVILIVAIIIAAIPTAGPILVGIVAAVFGLFIAFVGIFVGLIIAGIAIAISGIVVIVYGLMKMFTWQPGGIMALGTGLILLALGVLLTVLMAKATGFVLPSAFRGLVELIRKPFHRKSRGGV